LRLKPGVGTGFDSKQMLSWRKGAVKGRHEQNGKDRLWLKIRNNNQIVSGFTVMMELTGSGSRGQEIYPAIILMCCMISSAFCRVCLHVEKGPSRLVSFILSDLIELSGWNVR
jgi:hypothetical protein